MSERQVRQESPATGTAHTPLRIEGDYFISEVGPSLMRIGENGLRALETPHFHAELHLIRQIDDAEDFKVAANNFLVRHEKPSMTTTPTDFAQGMAAIVQRFSIEAVKLGVPSDRREEAGLQMFGSMSRQSEKLAVQNDRMRRKAGLPVTPRGAPHEELVGWLSQLPETEINGVIRNNARPYAPLYISVPELQNEALPEANRPADAARPREFVLVSIDKTDTAAFNDIGLYQETASVLKGAAERIGSGWDGKRLELKDTNGNVVGAMELASVQLGQYGKTFGNASRGIRVEVDPSVYGGDLSSGSQLLASYVAKAGEELSDRGKSFELRDKQNRVIGGVLINEEAPNRAGVPLPVGPEV